MDVKAEPRAVYHRIGPYQTRIIFLHGDNGIPNSPLVCNLYPADILHPKFEGLGLRSSAGQKDIIVGYDALSYTWGHGERSETIICNDVRFQITQNLFGALQTLRHSHQHARYLWVDAICINQDDDNEKAVQVWHMLEIYQKATRVIAWLGAAQEGLKNVLDLAFWRSNRQKKSYNFSSIIKGMTHLYTRPWFQRIWVQQEIFAARNLFIQCGNFQFEWPQLLSKPELLFALPHLQSHVELRKDQIKFKKKIPDHIATDVNAISTLIKLHKRLHCFEQFSVRCPIQPDFIDTLLSTNTLGAKNPKDYIYGIIGMTKFPAKAMSLQEWIVARQHEIFIPIDYSADLISIYITVTWAILMKGGLAVLAKFKASTPPNNRTHKHPLPSWVIDWRLAARLFYKTGNWGSKADLRLEGTWDVLKNLGGSRKWILWHSPFERKTFYNDNKQSSISYTKLVLRGIIDPNFYGKGKWVREKLALGISRGVWHLEFEVNSTDVIVKMLNFCTIKVEESKYDIKPKQYSAGLWLLRPIGDGEFRLLKCLLWSDDERPPIYDNWECDPQEHLVKPFYQIAKMPSHYKHNLAFGGSTGIRKFTIA